ncbi:hypothetical protein GCM10022291_30650 [Postechiella marina]|uniref:Uncharacterized protein n=1 Tax=Postechiella marina TaxID=943941 RepID=A0ABP8CFY3_9FLAO
MRIYENAEEIAKDLEVLKLKRDISIEELKLVKQSFKEDLSLANWVQTILKTIGKVGFFKIAKKII